MNELGFVSSGAAWYEAAHCQVNEEEQNGR